MTLKTTGTLIEMIVALSLIVVLIGGTTLYSKFAYRRDDRGDLI
jgi:hypothetical protein